MCLCVEIPNPSKYTEHEDKFAEVPDVVAGVLGDKWGCNASKVT